MKEIIIVTERLDGRTKSTNFDIDPDDVVKNKISDQKFLVDKNPNAFRSRYDEFFDRKMINPDCSQKKYSLPDDPKEYKRAMERMNEYKNLYFKQQFKEITGREF